MSSQPRADRQWHDKIMRRERFTDFAYTLARIDWDFFTTHTYKNPLPRPDVRAAMVWRWCQDVSKVSGVPYKNLLIALRREQGEIGGRPHEHCLIGGLTSCNMMTVRSQMMRSWKIISGNAFADFRLYDRSLAGADYICKCLGANAYEVNKFSLAEETTLSDSVFRVVRTLDLMSERRCRELKRKDRQVLEAPGHKTPAQHDSGAKACPASVPAGLPGVSRI